MPRKVSTLMKKLTINKGRIAAAVSVLAVVVSPAIASAASDTANTVINATINAAITISTATPVAISLTPTSSAVLTSASDTVTVSTNRSTGYNLAVADSDANTNLVNGGNNIAAHSGTKASPTALANNTWGFAVNSGTTGIGANGFDASYSTESNSTTSTSLWAGMPASGSPVMLKTTASTASGDTTTVWYAAKVNLSLPDGVYTDTVTYTATTN